VGEPGAEPVFMAQAIQHQFLDDGVHLNEKGARLVARALTDRLGPMLLEHDRRVVESRRATPTSASK